MTTPETDDRLARLEALVTTQADRIAELERRLAARKDGAVAEQVLHTSTSRRDLFRRGAAAVGAGVAGASILGAQPAAAADGENVVIGNVNASATETAIESSDAVADTELTGNVFTAADQNTGGASGFPAAVGAWAFGRNVYNGLFAYADDRAGRAETGHAVVAWATGRARSNVFLRPSLTDPTETAFFRNRGELVATADGKLWFCTESGSPGEWVELSATGPRFLDPAERAFDSRSGQLPDTEAPAAKGKFAAGEERTIDLGAETSLPSLARSVMLNITVANTGGGGFLTAFNADVTRPTASTLNWFTGNTQVANTTVVPCNDDQQITIYTSNAANVILDVIGWYGTR